MRILRLLGLTVFMFALFILLREFITIVWNASTLVMRVFGWL